MTTGLGPRAGSTGGTAAGLRELFGELGDCKRIRSTGRTGSIAERGFAACWAALVAGADVDRVMRWGVAAALPAARLGDLDKAKLRELGVDADASATILRRAFDAVTDPVDAGLRHELRTGLDEEPPSAPLPSFVAALAAQPRAGATCPGRPRIILEPPENHAEHCWAVAVFGVLLAPIYRADPRTVFLAGLSHHLHNATMPDSGFTGEMLLGPHLAPVCERATQRALAELSPDLHEAVIAARAILPDASTAEGRAFHAADVIDRVMQLSQYLRAASLTIDMLLGDWHLVHDGPVKAFHDGVLVEMGLA